MYFLIHWNFLTIIISKNIQNLKMVALQIWWQFKMPPSYLDVNLTYTIIQGFCWLYDDI
jgi:hypothetical protein